MAIHRGGQGLGKSVVTERQDRRQAMLKGILVGIDGSATASRLSNWESAGRDLTHS
jgi:hypothetical protein